MKYVFEFRTFVAFSRLLSLAFSQFRLVEMYRADYDVTMTDRNYKTLILTDMLFTYDPLIQMANHCMFLRHRKPKRDGADYM